MAAILQVSGTVQDIIDLAKVLEAGLRGTSPELNMEEVSFLRRDNIINAIKSYRQRANVGLKEAKDFVESTAEGRAYLERHHARRGY